MVRQSQPLTSTLHDAALPCPLEIRLTPLPPSVAPAPADGFVRGPVYPDGPWRPASSVQRGSTLFYVCPGSPDPSRDERCGVPSADRRPRIPVFPIGYGNAELLLRGLGGAVVPEGWQGGIRLADGYFAGPGPIAIEMHSFMQQVRTDIWNTIATIPGETDELVLIGNHRDAWAYGGVDPNSGSAVRPPAAPAAARLLCAIEGASRVQRHSLL